MKTTQFLKSYLDMGKVFPISEMEGYCQFHNLPTLSKEPEFILALVKHVLEQLRFCDEELEDIMGHIAFLEEEYENKLTEQIVELNDQADSLACDYSFYEECLGILTDRYLEATV